MGLPAVAAASQPPPRADDIVLRGYFVSVDQGSAGKRVLVGFDSGAAELSTAVEAYQMTAEGMRRLGRGEIKSEGGKLPGIVLPAAVLGLEAIDEEGLKKYRKRACRSAPISRRWSSPARSASRWRSTLSPIRIGTRSASGWVRRQLEGRGLGVVATAAHPTACC